MMNRFLCKRIFVLALAGLVLPLLFFGLMQANVLEASQPAAPAANDVFYVDAARDDGLVAHWRFDEVGQSHTADTSKTQAHGALSGNAQIDDSALPPGLLLPNSGALLLDGSGDYVDTADFDLPDDFTIALWANTDNPAADQNMVGKHDGSGGNQLLFGIYRGKYHARIRGEFFDFNQTALPGWQHLTITGQRFDNTTLVGFWLNGNQIESVTLNASRGRPDRPRPGPSARIGTAAARTDFFDGRLDDLRIYNRKLTAAEIGQLAAGEDHDGASWADAYSTLERALGAADGRDEIWVAAGVYTPTRPLDPSEIRSATFQLKPDVDVYGGFMGSETAVDQRDPIANVTVLSGDIDGNDTTNNQGVVITPTHIAGSNAFHVLYATGIAPQATTLDGFTITAGNALFDGGNFSDAWGGGMYIFEADPILSQLNFQGNAADLGGGVHVLAGDPELPTVSFTANTAELVAAACLLEGAAPKLTDLNFSANRARLGGGMFSSNADFIAQPGYF